MRLSLEQIRAQFGEEAIKQIEKQIDKVPKLRNKLERKNTAKLHNKTNPAHDKLVLLVKSVFNDETKYKIEPEAKLIEGRRYASDVAVHFISKGNKESLIKGVSFELDGYRHHGLSLSGFKRDREKDRLTLLSGYIVARFYASEVLDEPEKSLSLLVEFKEKYSSK